jgi:FMN phosphatase YigB (HAD superfamily)
MKRAIPTRTLFLDIGGVLLTNRHHLIFDTYEEGKLRLEEYLGRALFYKKRPFTRSQFRSFMFAQSKPYPERGELVLKLKPKYGLKIAVVSNEGRELNTYRIRKFKLAGFVDSLISSIFVQVRNPDADILTACAGHRSGASQGGSLYRKHPDVRPDRGRFGDSKHSSHGLQGHVRETGFVRIVE